MQIWQVNPNPGTWGLFGPGACISIYTVWSKHPIIPISHAFVTNSAYINEKNSEKNSMWYGKKTITPEIQKWRRGVIRACLARAPHTGNPLVTIGFPSDYTRGQYCKALIFVCFILSKLLWRDNRVADDLKRLDGHMTLLQCMFRVFPRADFEGGAPPLIFFQIWFFYYNIV